ncbi:type VI secretion system baseplate subunit TssG [Pseudosulfitobacter koreensis]|uniref:Type VI secretion system baseplate subunit TssG n=1 Tax=Pseudosulfitobacter koreensis TaxID=2968472 RepID=A0ABT1Z2J3_9RHOB|nr:type VI secretion system baseplate subunit TssG [Pseudosulfitobacter koreense]MCR8827354.1 type VI secretion system baseplate subunit TssG [Pseudosulfitobacter koreense]
MAPQDRSGPDPLTHLQRLSDDPEKHHIFHAFRILEAAFPDAPRLGEARRPREDKVRFGQEAELSFPPSTVAGFKPPAGSKPGRLTNRFFGLFGPQGPLPLHLTEHARARLRHHRDPTFVEFANILTHRLMTLLYRAWRSGQPAPSFDRGNNDGIERKIAAIAGYHGAHLRERDDLPDLAKRHFAGLLAQGPKNAEGLRSIVEAFFGTKVQVQEFVGCWLELEPDDRWRMGVPAALGRTTSIGERVWTRSAKFRLRLGPLSLADYTRLLPGGASLPRLRAIVRNYAGDAMDWDVNLVLRADEIPRAKLGETVRLGQTSWIGESKIKKDADNLFLEPNAQMQMATMTGRT